MPADLISCDPGATPLHQPSLLEGLTLCCPVCPVVRELTFVSLATASTAGEGALRCYGPGGCGRAFPIRRGIPILHPEPAAFCRAEERALAGELELGPGRGADFLAAYSWAAWADAIPADPQAEELHRWAVQYRGELDRYTERIAARARSLGAGPGLLLDLGCGLGRETRQLARYGLPAVGLDLRYEVLHQALCVEHTGRAAWLEKIPGREYRWRDLEPPPG
ncbi:MAG: hypothetical protein FJ125_10875, partial [Deltaproteobacteria bacterium]|nr:hypothetical protein [Deltaproteobacteria bacterium]